MVVEANGVSSNAFPIVAKATQPAIYAVPNAASTTYFVTAALQGTGFLVGNRAVDSRVVRAVFPGDVLDLYMIGLGATANPSDFITNQEFSGAFPVSAPVTATVNGESAPVIFAGLTSPGLYLVRISIPSDLQPGSPAIQVSTGNPSAGGAQTSSLLALTIGTPAANLIQNGNFGSALAGTWSLNVNSCPGRRRYRSDHDGDQRNERRLVGANLCDVCRIGFGKLRGRPIFADRPVARARTSLSIDVLGQSRCRADHALRCEGHRR